MTFMPLVLWRDDLDRIVAILGKNGGNVELVASENSFETVAEMVDHFGVIHPLSSLQIKGRNPFASIDLDRIQARLYVTAENGSGVFFELSNVLAARQRRWPFLYSYPFLWILILLNLWPNLTKAVFGWAGYMAVASSAVVLAWAGWIGFIRLRHHAVVRLARRVEAQSFWQRNKDPLIVAVVAAVVGALLGIAGTKLADKLWTPNGGDKGQVTPPQKNN
jgi:hypothetical protein